MREKLESILIADGWRPFTDQFSHYGQPFYKRFETPTPCAGNDDKPGMQVVIKVYPPYSPEADEGFEMDVSGELPDGSWIKLFQWGFHGRDIQDGLAVIPRLLAIWEFAANYEPITPPQKAEKE